MKKANPESKVTCDKCIFCGGNDPLSCSVYYDHPITRQEYYTRPVWCPFGGKPF